MKALEIFANTTKRLSLTLQRLAVSFVTHPALANYTLSGPGGIAAGRHAAAGTGDRQVLRDTSGQSRRLGRGYPVFNEFSRPCQE